MKIEPSTTAIICKSLEEAKAILLMLKDSGFNNTEETLKFIEDFLLEKKEVGLRINTRLAVGYGTIEYYNQHNFTIKLASEYLNPQPTTEKPKCICDLWAGCTCGAITPYKPVWE